MSTKCSYFYGDDYHIYFDYKDFDIHLEQDGKEIPINSGLKTLFRNLSQLKDSIEGVRLALKWISDGEQKRRENGKEESWKQM
jgi:hypothetical protein